MKRNQKRRSILNYLPDSLHLVAKVKVSIFFFCETRQVTVLRVCFTPCRNCTLQPFFDFIAFSEPAHTNRIFLRTAFIGFWIRVDAASVYLLSINIPLQVFPSPVYPALHDHVYEPALFWQTELTSQEWEPVVHSSKSKRENHIVKRLNTLYYYPVLKVKNSFLLYIVV